MLMYVLVGLCLVLLGVAGLQFTYLAYVDRMNNERRKYLKALEKNYSELSARLSDAEQRVAEQNELLEQLSPGITEDTWADVIGRCFYRSSTMVAPQLPENSGAFLKPFTK